MIARPGAISTKHRSSILIFMNKDKQVLGKYFPEKAVDLVFTQLQSKKVQLRISRKRHTKLGDFRHEHNGKPHRISINHNLSPYSFLIVFVHELAHLYVYEQYGNRVMPHGKEWKMAFRQLMQPYFSLNIFPPDIEHALLQYLQNARAANGTDLNLTRVLNNYDHAGQGTVEVEALADNTVFSMPDGRVFKKLSRVRKRYKCICMQTQKIYLFNPLTQVMPVTTDAS